jgi:hypothetical protein
LSIFLAVAIGLIGWTTYRLWHDSPEIMPTPSKAGPVGTSSEKQPMVTPRAAVSTDTIVSKNLFDPERGAGASREAEESSRSFQRIKNLILLGTVIIGSNRTAIVQDGSNVNLGQPVPAQPVAPMRLKLGDNIEGYRLAEIADKRVVFAKDTARVEVPLDYFRKVDVTVPRTQPPGQIVQPAGVAPQPRVLPNLPRRGRVPTPGNPNPES